jgi:16S rRNA (cytidine1402-2'-O)-methyltransferase
VLPAPVLERVRQTRDFVVESARTARRFLAACNHPGPIAALRIAILDEHTRQDDVAPLLAPLREGRSLGLLSEAGAPAVADPGAQLVAAAHAEGFRVVPFVGASSILLALMASGLDGQRFRFSGYLPVATAERQAAIRELEARSASARETQVFIETPYRNDALLADVVRTCRDDTRLAVAAELTGPGESIRMASVARWRAAPLPPGKRPAIFLLLAASASRRR